MNSSSAVTGYISALVLVGLCVAVFGTLLPLGGGLTVALIGAASIGAGLVLIGVRMMGHRPLGDGHPESHDSRDDK